MTSRVGTRDPVRSITWSTTCLLFRRRRRRRHLVPMLSKFHRIHRRHANRRATAWSSSSFGCRSDRKYPLYRLTRHGCNTSATCRNRRASTARREAKNETTRVPPAPSWCPQPAHVTHSILHENTCMVVVLARKAGRVLIKGIVRLHLLGWVVMNIQM